MSMPLRRQTALRAFVHDPYAVCRPQVVHMAAKKQQLLDREVTATSWKVRCTYKAPAGSRMALMLCAKCVHVTAGRARGPVAECRRSHVACTFLMTGLRGSPSSQ